MKFDLPPRIPAKRDVVPEAPKPKQAEQPPRQRAPLPLQPPVHGIEAGYGDDFLIDQSGDVEAPPAGSGTSASPPRRDVSSSVNNEKSSKFAPGLSQSQCVWLGVGVGVGALLFMGVVGSLVQPASQSVVSTEAAEEVSTERPVTAVAAADTPIDTRMPVETPTETPSAPESGLEALLVDLRKSRAAETPASSAPPLQHPSAAPRIPPATYRVVKVKSGDMLNLRQGPGSNYAAVAGLPAGLGGIVLGAKRFSNDGTIWREVSVAGYTGYVNESYLAAENPMR